MRKISVVSGAGVTAVLLFSALLISRTSAFAGQDAAPGRQSVDPLVPNGTHFLVRLDDELSTATSKLNKKFNAITLEPLEASTGYVLAPGAKIHGHISRIEPGQATGHARLWLTFDDIDTRRGRLPIVAEVSSVPGDFSVRQGESKEGEIEARTSKVTRDLEASAAGAAVGAAPGAVKHNGKEAAAGAVAGGFAGFMASSGIGQEIDLQKGTKLDLVLDRPLYLVQ